MEDLIKMLKMCEGLSAVSRETLISNATDDFIEFFSIYEELRKKFSCDQICRTLEFLEAEEKQRQ